MIRTITNSHAAKADLDRGKRRFRRLFWWLVGTLIVMLVITPVLVVGHRYQKQLTFIRKIESAGGNVPTERSPQWLSNLVGDQNARGFEDYFYVSLAPPDRAELLRELSYGFRGILHFYGGEIDAEQADAIRSLAASGQIDAIQIEQCASIDPRLYEALSQQSSLTALIHWYSNVSLVNLARLRKMESLELLSLAHSTVTEEDVRLQPQEFPALRRLNLAETYISDKTFSAFEDLCPQITFIDLSQTDITDESLRLLSRAHHLEELILDDTDITDEGLQQLHGLTHLKLLSVSDTKVTDEGIRSLRERVTIDEVRRE